MNDTKFTRAEQGDDTDFYKHVSTLLAEARQFAKKQLDSTIVTTYYVIGQMIVEREQQGEKRAQYGRKLIHGRSEYLTKQYGRGFSVVNLQNMRNFYQIYTSPIQQSLTVKSEAGESTEYLLGVNIEKQQSLTAKFKLSWTHYQILIRIDNAAARHFYEIEAASQQWSVRQLQRQVGSALYERLALSCDKDKVTALAYEGQTMENPHQWRKSNGRYPAVQQKRRQYRRIDPAGGQQHVCF